MRTDHDHEETNDPLAKLGYEVADIEYKGLAKSIGWFLGFVVFCGVAGVVIFGLFLGNGNPVEAWNKLTVVPESTTAFTKRIPSDPNPLLQTNITTKTDIRDLRREESKLLHDKPAYIDQAKGIVRIPIDRAIDIYARQQASGGNAATTTGEVPAATQPPVAGGGAAVPSGHN